MADYNINAVTRRVVYSGSAGTGPYAFSFEVLVSSDIVVYFNSTSLTLTTDYTVTINANGTGSVTIVTGTNVPTTPDANDTIIIVGARDIERTTDFVTAGDLLAASLNEQLDGLTIFDQQIAEEQKRSLMAPVYDPAHVDDGGTLDMTLPAKADRLGKYLAFNATTGNPEAGPTTTDVTTLAAVTSDIATLADIEDGTDATDAIQTVAGISANVTTVAGISANVTTVAGNTSNINAVAADATDIGTVAGISSDVTTVAGISSDVTTVAADGTDIGTVAGISANVTTVAGISSDVTTVAGISGDVSSVAAQVIGYDFSTTTAMADPGSGNVRFNNATVASVTAIAIDDLDKNGVDQSAYIALFDDSTNTVKGTLVFRTGGGDVATFNITGLTDNTGWFQIAVTHVASSGTFADGEDTFIGFTRAGDKGADGAGSGDVSGPGSATDNAVVRWDGTSGQLVQNSGVTINDSGDLTANNLSGTHSGTSSGTNTGDEVAASESTAGVVELATTAEAEAGTDTVRAVTPAGAAAAIAALAVSPANFNIIINGNMAVAQRGTSFASPSSGSYTLDRWRYQFSGAAVVTITQDTDTPDETFPFSLKVDVTTADASIGAGDFSFIQYAVEGFDSARLAFGSSDAQSVTLSFWVKSPKTGTHCVGFVNNAADRNYIAEYTVNVADTWEQKTITLTGDTTGTWVGATNGLGLRLRFSLAAGSTYQGSASTWQAGNLFATSSQANVTDNTANNFFLTGVKLEVGSTATDFVPDDYGTALAKCQRYYCETGTGLACYLSSASQNFVSDVYPVEMRAAPTITLLDTSPTIQGATAEETGVSSAIDFSNIGTLGAALRINGFTQTTGESGFMANGTTKVFAHSAEL